ncbi:hypothetical protein D3C87_1155110 [compost metagenome]
MEIDVDILTFHFKNILIRGDQGSLDYIKESCLLKSFYDQSKINRMISDVYDHINMIEERMISSFLTLFESLILFIIIIIVFSIHLGIMNFIALLISSYFFVYVISSISDDNKHCKISKDLLLLLKHKEFIIIEEL